MGGIVFYVKFFLFFEICVLVLLMEVCCHCAFFIMLHTWQCLGITGGCSTRKLLFISRHVGDCINSAMYNWLHVLVPSV